MDQGGTPVSASENSGQHVLELLDTISSRYTAGTRSSATVHPPGKCFDGSKGNQRTNKSPLAAVSIYSEAEAVNVSQTTRGAKGFSVALWISNSGLTLSERAGN